MKSETKIPVPRDASTVILLNQDKTKVLWAQRNPNLKFLGGWHAFPGGKVEQSDGEIAVQNCEDASLNKFIVAAVRECFEEVGVLLVRGGEKLTKGQRASLHSDLISGVFTFAEILESWNLWIDARDFSYAGFWTTPQFSPVRFKTRFFLAVCPPRQTAYAAVSEMRNVEFVEPRNALERWKKSEVLISPPVLITLQELTAAAKRTENFSEDESGLTQVNRANQATKNISQKLLEKSQLCDGEIVSVALNPRVVCFPVKTETLPPATHTNCFIVGKKEFVVIDAAPKIASERQKLFTLIDSFVEKNFVCQAIIISHLHRDHIGAETILQKHLRDKFGLKVPIAAHRLTAESLGGAVKIDKFIEDKDVFKLADEEDNSFDLTVLHTPGHTRGLVAFYDEVFGFLLSGDNVVGADSVIIAEPEGNMTDYLASLERLKNLPNLRFLCGSHGAATFDARSKIEKYLAHRLERERRIVAAIESGAENISEIVGKVYADVSPDLWKLAEKSVKAHLAKIETDKNAPQVLPTK